LNVKVRPSDTPNSNLNQSFSKGKTTFRTSTPNLSYRSGYHCCQQGTLKGDKVPQGILGLLVTRHVCAVVDERPGPGSSDTLPITKVKENSAVNTEIKGLLKEKKIG
jgi:hypothetical protein